jgi:GDP-L-fucose synthase
MRVLIFGGSGFLGGRLIPKLREQGHEVIAPRSSEINLAHPVTPRPEHTNIDVVVHAAAFYGGMPFDLENASRIFSTNSLMNINVFEYCRQIMPRHLVTIGSACSYPGYVDKDFDESDFFTGPLHHTVVCQGFSKLTMLVAHEIYWSSHKLAGIHLVPANLYGPGDVYTIERAHVVAALIRKYSDAMANNSDVYLMGDGTPVREFLYIDDLADMIVAAVERRPDGVRVLNAGTGQGHSVRQLSDIIADKIGFSGRTHWDPSLPNGAQRKVMRVDRLQSELGPLTPISLQAGIAKTLAWYLPNKAQADARA